MAENMTSRLPMSSPPGLSSSVSSSPTGSSSFDPATPQRSSTRPGGDGGSGGFPHHSPSPDLARIASPSSSPAAGTPTSHSRRSSFLAGFGIGGARSTKGKEREGPALAQLHPSLGHTTSVAGFPPSPSPFGGHRTTPSTPLLFTPTRSPVPSRPSSPSLLTLTRPPTPLSSISIGPAPDSPSPPSFDDVLPREIKLLVFRSLIDLWIAEEHRARVRGDRWTGEGAGRRELIKLSRVSKAWTTLVFDGSLWPALSTSSFPFAGVTQPAPSADTLKAANVLHLAAHAGTFVRSLVLRDIDLSSVELRKVGLELAGDADATRETKVDDDDLAFERSAGHDSTGLRSLDLRACRGVGEGALGQLLAKSSHLTTVDLSHQPVVTGTLVALLASSSPQLESVSLSHCSGLVAADLLPLLAAPDNSLEKLHIAGFKGMNVVILRAIGRSGGRLKSLDLSYTDVTDSALAALVAIPQAEAPKADSASVRLVVSHGGQYEPLRQGETYALRVFPALQHLNLSVCRSLSDVGAAHLTDATPALRFLQLASLGRLPAHLLAREPVNPPPLARLIASLPALEKVDFEDSDATDDDVLRLLAASCARVEHVVVSGCRRLSAAGLGHVVSDCRALRVLEADGTRITDAQVKAFVEGFRAMGLSSAALSVLDSQLISRSAIVPLLPLTRPRAGMPGFAFAPFGFQSHVPRPVIEVAPTVGAPSQAGRDELDTSKPVLSCFWAWGVVDSVRKEVAREARARETALAAAAAAASAANSSPKRARDSFASISNVTAARRTLGWRTASSGSVALLGAPGRPTSRRSMSQPATPVSGRHSAAGRSDDLRGCTVM